MGDEKNTCISQIFLASLIGGALFLAAIIRHRKWRDHIIPLLKTPQNNHLNAFKLEKFPHYVARQLGFADRRQCPHLCKLALDYVRRSEGCEEAIAAFFSEETDAGSLCVKLLEELERCILSYFAFHWRHADLAITNVLVAAEFDPKKKLRSIVMAATREQRFERVSKSLKMTNVFSTLVAEMKAIGVNDDSKCTDVMVPMAHKDRSPVLLFMGGGMGAGKSTVLLEILKESFWAGASPNAMVIEADKFKESDLRYRALSSRGHHYDMMKTAELVHQSSTDAASSLLVTALNDGRDVIMDGTLSWEPFVVQTVTMARNVHRHRYRMGVGYKLSEDGVVIENYWEQVKEDRERPAEENKRRPYRIELVGVVCDAYLAVIRGIRRAIISRRAVRVSSQLTSHQRFANAFVTYCQLVDNSRLYSTNALEGLPKLIGWKEKDKNLLLDPEEIGILKLVGRLNKEADSVYELYKYQNPAYRNGSIWKEIVMSPSRISIQKELKFYIQKIEGSKCYTDAK